jgi:hypothetical protein
MSKSNLPCLNIELKSTHLWSKLSHLKQQLIINTPKYRQIRQNLSEVMASLPSDQQLVQIRAIRNWVNINSKHLIGTEHDQYAFNLHQVLEMLWLHHHNGQKLPHLSCGPRSYAMKEILNLLNIKTRIIDVFQIWDASINAHTLIEVYCEELNCWLLQDPDFNVEYVLSAYPDKPLSSLEILRCDKSQVIYATNGFNVDNEVNCTNTINDCFDQCILYRNSYEGKKSTLLVTDKAILNINLYQQNETLTVRQFMKKRGHTPTISHLNDNAPILL